MTYLVDTSVLTRLGRPVVRDRLVELDSFGIARTAMSDLEVGFSARSGREWDEVHRALSVFRSVEIQPEHFGVAAAVQRRLADAGLLGRKVPDLLIAAVAATNGLSVLHYDADFDHISSVTSQPTEWVVPRGSID